MHPAIFILLRSHAAARLRRFRQSFATRRRLLLTLCALVLGVVWLGQTLASVLMREPYNPVEFYRWTAGVLTLYFCWHIVRVAYRRPETAIEWSGAEREQIVGGPFTRRDVLTYRFVVILTSTLPKALLTALVLSPDLWWSGLPGIVLALVFLECFRLAIDIAVCCLPNGVYLLARAVVIAGVSAGIGCAIWTATADPSTGPASLQPGPIFGSAMQIVEQPFVVFTNVITAQAVSLSLAVDVLLACAMVAGMLAVVAMLDRCYESICRSRQSAMDHTIGRAVARETGESSHRVKLPHVPRWGAVGPLLWRQFKSAARYRGSLLVALAIPAVMSCLPLFSIADPTKAFLAVVAGVVFYSIVLLPEAVKFDFRLDCDHLAKLKMLPIGPARIVIGQLATPILLATGFQMLILLFAGCVRSASPVLVGWAWLLTIPVNVFFVALDNLIFLLYPHRPTQEGFEAFLRTILKFTFKSVLLGVAAGLLVFWAAAARVLSDTMGLAHAVQAVFCVGIGTAALLFAFATVAMVVKAFDRYDLAANAVA